MNELREKTVAQSYTEHVQILMQEHMNGYRRLFGGRLMEWVDIVAAVVSRRHSNAEVTTVFIDNLHFTAPAYVNETIYLTGRMTYVGNTSMEVKVETFVESLVGERKKINTAYVVMVALDKDENPLTVPRLLCETEEEKEEFLRGKKRHELRRQRRIDKY